ncbi:hypothetical protein KBD81_04070 [Candidatus Woesebacteria bacterium]|nr:hypothetical protein [Candidatus Woesebacteria bacterium]
MKHLKSFHFNLISTSLLFTFFATSVFVLYSAYTSIVPARQMEGGQLLGVTTDTWTLKKSSDAYGAYVYYCLHTSSSCTILKFCKERPQHCTTSDIKTPSSSTTDSTTFINTTGTDTAATIPTQTPTPSFTPTPTVEEKEDTKDSKESTEHKPSPTPTQMTPTPITRLTTQQTYCYDSDGDSIAANGVCRDASGSYYDSCSKGVVSEYICENNACLRRMLSCPSGKSCLNNRCVDLPTVTPVPSTSTMVDSPTVTPKILPTSEIQTTRAPLPSPTIEKQVAVTESPVTPSSPPQESIPRITSPQNGTQISGLVRIVVSQASAVNTTLLLQQTNNSADRISVGKIALDGTKVWDTTLVPNGDYHLYAVSHGVVNKAISEPVTIAISNAIPSSKAAPVIILSSEFKPEKVEVRESITIQKVEKPPEERSSAIEFTGTAEPYQVITILIYSNPIVVTVRADVNGVWTYSLDEPLEPGNHEAYVVVPQEDGTQVRSELSGFFVPQIYAASADNETLQRASAKKSPMIFNFILLSIILILDAIVVLLIVYRFRSQKKSHV